MGARPGDGPLLAELYLAFLMGLVTGTCAALAVPAVVTREVRACTNTFCLSLQGRHEN